VKRHLRPTPRILHGQALRERASSAIDLSDGLISDLGHILKASGVARALTWICSRCQRNCFAMLNLSRRCAGRCPVVKIMNCALPFRS
jgi:hypothetical protein